MTTYTFESLHAQRGDEIKALYSELSKTQEYAKIKELGDNPDDIIASHILHAFNAHPQNEKYRFSMLQRKLVHGVDVASNRDNRGMILGTIDDRWDTEKLIPETYLLLQSNGEFRKITSFRHNIYNGPGIYTMSWDYNEQYGNYTAKKILRKDELTFNPVNILSQVAKTCDDEYWDNLNNVEYKPVVVLKGRIVDVSPVPIFEDKKVIGEHSLQTQNLKTPMPDLCPTMRLKMRSSGSPCTYFNINFGATTNSVPFFGLPDFDTLLDSIVNSQKSMDEQLEDLKDYFDTVAGEIYVIGYVTKRRESTSKYTEEKTTNFEIRGSAVISGEYKGFEKSALENVEKPHADNVVVDAKMKLQEMAFAESKSEPTRDVSAVSEETPVEEKPVSKKKTTSVKEKADSLFECADDSVVSTVETTKEAENTEKVLSETNEENTKGVDENPKLEVSDTKSTKKSMKSVKTMSYSDNPSEFYTVAIQNAIFISKKLYKTPEGITVEFLRKIVGGTRPEDVPLSIWKMIAEKVKEAL